MMMTPESKGSDEQEEVKILQQQIKIVERRVLQDYRAEQEAEEEWTNTTEAHGVGEKRKLSKEEAASVEAKKLKATIDQMREERAQQRADAAAGNMPGQKDEL